MQGESRPISISRIALQDAFQAHRQLCTNGLPPVAQGQAQCKKIGLELAGDNRVAIIATLFLPVVGWVRTHICLTGSLKERTRTWL